MRGKKVRVGFKSARPYSRAFSFRMGMCALAEAFVPRAAKPLTREFDGGSVSNGC